jgi:hypothetical protein
MGAFQVNIGLTLETVMSRKFLTQNPCIYRGFSLERTEIRPAFETGKYCRHNSDPHTSFVIRQLQLPVFWSEQALTEML